jgi:ribonuclease PH
MDFNLLKQLLPGECIEYTTRAGIRSGDGRKSHEHRQFEFTRKVLGQGVSCSVKLGGTHVLCSVKNIENESEGSLIQTNVVVQLQMARDATSVNIRRDLV